MDNLICYVEECKYYRNQACTANKIKVDTSNGSLRACSSKDTACETFEPRR